MQTALRLLKKRGLPLLIALTLAVCLLAALSGGGDDHSTAEEKRVASVLSRIAGAGQVRVALFYAQSGSDGWGGAKSTPVGAIVVAEGAGDIGVRLSLTRAVRTLLNLPESAVDVFAMADGGD